MYTLLELSNIVTKHHFPSFPDVPTQITSTPSMSKSLASTSNTPMLAAEILIPQPNSYPTPYLYLSNRNDPSPLGDIISVFNLSDDMKMVSEVRSGLNHLRGMAFGGMDDRWLIAGGVNEGGVSVFERVDGGKGLRVVAEQKDVEAPTGFYGYEVCLRTM
jgi:6-phosphogluconolactonase (cycloisomerase 2 family)